MNLRTLRESAVIRWIAFCLLLLTLAWPPVSKFGEVVSDEESSGASPHADTAAALPPGEFIFQPPDTVNRVVVKTSPQPRNVRSLNVRPNRGPPSP